MNTIDLPLTWSGLMPALIAALRDGTDKGRHIAEQELRMMALAADRWNAHAGPLIDAVRRAELLIRSLSTDIEATALEPTLALLADARRSAETRP